MPFFINASSRKSLNLYMLQLVFATKAIFCIGAIASKPRDSAGLQQNVTRRVVGDGGRGQFVGCGGVNWAGVRTFARKKRVASGPGARHQDNNMEITANTAEALRLTAEEFESIRQKLGRTPNFTELCAFSAMWSEHCSYKNSIKWLKTLPR